MSTTDIVMKSIENMILYGIELDIKEEDYHEYLSRLSKFYNSTDHLIGNFNGDTVIVESITTEPICTIFIEKGAIRITPTGSEHGFSAITTLLEFIAEQTTIFDDKIKETKEEINEGDDNEFEWI